jgi:polyhydroxyalkanoate synthesis regulator phasin
MGVAPEQALATILKDLVSKGTLTQAQADAVTAAAVAAKAAHDANRPQGGKGGPLGADRAAIETLVSTTIGVDTATIKSRLQAGESLAQIAGTKKDALIAALVADETKRIDAAVTAGKLTAAQATEMKTNLVAHVTEEVNAVGGKAPFGKGPKGGKGGHGGRGGHDHGGPMGGGMGGATAPTLPAPSANAGA